MVVFYLLLALSCCLLTQLRLVSLGDANTEERAPFLRPLGGNIIIGQEGVLT